MLFRRSVQSFLAHHIDGLYLISQRKLFTSRTVEAAFLRSFHFKNFYAVYKNHTLFLVKIIIKHSVYYLVSGLLVLNLMPSTVAYNRKKHEKRSIKDKHSMEEITKYFESVSVKALINTAEDFKIDLKNAVPWLILENQQYMKEKEKRQKENLLTQIVVTLLTITLSSVTNAIGDGTNEAIRRGVMVSLSLIHI